MNLNFINFIVINSFTYRMQDWFAIIIKEIILLLCCTYFLRLGFNQLSFIEPGNYITKIILKIVVY